MTELPFEWMERYYVVGRRAVWLYGRDYMQPGGLELPCTGFEFQEDDGLFRWQRGEQVLLSDSGDFAEWDDACDWAREAV